MYALTATRDTNLSPGTQIYQWWAAIYYISDCRHQWSIGKLNTLYIKSYGKGLRHKARAVNDQALALQPPNGEIKPISNGAI